MEDHTVASIWLHWPICDNYTPLTQQQLQLKHNSIDRHLSVFLLLLLLLITAVLTVVHTVVLIRLILELFLLIIHRHRRSELVHRVFLVHHILPVIQEHLRATVWPLNSGGYWPRLVNTSRGFLLPLQPHLTVSHQVNFFFILSYSIM